MFHRLNWLLVRAIVLTSSLFVTSVASAQRGSVDSDTGDAGTGGRYVIQGTVYFPSGQRVDRLIRVRLFTMTRGDMTTTTDNNGRFSFRRLSAGTYTIVIDAEKEYEPISERINIVQATPRSVNLPEESITVQIRLKLRQSDRVKPSVINADLAKVPPRALELYDKALELSLAKKNGNAIEKLKQAISLYSDFMLAYNELGVQYMRLGDLEKADESLRSALKIAPNAFEPLMNHGIVLVRLKRFKEAEPELRNALKQKEESAVGHDYLGRALAYLGLFEEAEKELTSAITLGRDEMKEAHRYLAGVYNALGDRAHAIAELETYLRLAPKSNDAEQIRELIRKLRAAN